MSTPNLKPTSRIPFKQDAALKSPPTVKYLGNTIPWTQARAQWALAIKSEELKDIEIRSVYDLVVDPRDGALTRGEGGSAYTLRAWQQLYALMGAALPRNTASVDFWHKPRTRCNAWEDVKDAGTRTRPTHSDEREVQKAAVIGRMFRDPVSGLRAFRAMVSDKHSLEGYDDVNVIAKLDTMDAESRENNEAPARRIRNASVCRTTDLTWASFEMASVNGAALGFALRNSETNAASITFSGQCRLSVVDAVVRFPGTVSQELQVQVALRAGLARRRHTLPNFDSRTGERLTDTQRAAIAADRMGDDIEKALAEAAILADKWITAQLDVDPTLISLVEGYKTACSDEDKAAALSVLRDHLLEYGVGVASGVDATDAVISILATDGRLKSVPAGSAAQVAAALAVVARSGDYDHDDAGALMMMAGKLILEGFKK